MANNKIIYGGQVLIDLTADTIEASDVINNKTFHDKSGAILTGNCTYDADTSDANAVASEILINKTAYVSGAKVKGTMPNNGGAGGTINSKSQSVSVAQGYHDGSGKVSISSTEQAKIIAENIKSGIQILGVEGTYSGESVSAQAKTITPSGAWTSAQVVLPSEGFDYLSQVTVNEIPYVESPNAAGGTTVTIG